MMTGSFRRKWRLCEHGLRSQHPAVGSGPYIADIGFSVRAYAVAGGSALSPEMMRQMVDCGITLFLSEYSALKDDSEQSPQKT
jgi:hypothetical protein